MNGIKLTQKWNQLKINYRIPVINDDDELNDLYSNGDYIVCRTDNGECSNRVCTVSGANCAAAKNDLQKYHADEPWWKKNIEKKKRMVNNNKNVQIDQEAKQIGTK